MIGRLSDRAPSEVTEHYWLYAEAPPSRRPPPVRVGKWLVFVPTADVDQWWATIRTAVETGRLGCSAKAATARANRNEISPRTKVICVYTTDWRDQDDVRRVLRALREMGIGWRLTYKTDEATADGKYGPGSSTYVSQAGSGDFKTSHP